MLRVGTCECNPATSLLSPPGAKAAFQQHVPRNAVQVRKFKRSKCPVKTLCSFSLSQKCRRCKAGAAPFAYIAKERKLQKELLELGRELESVTTYIPSSTPRMEEVGSMFDKLDEFVILVMVVIGTLGETEPRKLDEAIKAEICKRGLNMEAYNEILRNDTVGID
ncbi:hypothetical protein DXG01_011257 [Tephrocybe rancida]|nr:hypothetical protein DXG01_011257 [Tephrocybe rancida]